MRHLVTSFLGTRTLALALLSSAAIVTPFSPVIAQQTLNVRDADIRAFIQDAAKVTGRSFIVDQRVQGKVSVVTDRPLSRSEYFEVFLATLRANGLVAVPASGGAFRIQPVQGAAAQPGRVGSRGAAQNAFVTEVFRLKVVDAASAVETLRPLVSKDGSVTANRSGNSVVVVDYGDNLKRIKALIRQIDRDNSSTRVLSLKHAGAREIATALQQLAAPSGGASKATLSVVAIDSSNSIALRGDPSSVARLLGIARELDEKAASGSEIRVIWLKYASADALLPVLEKLAGQRASASAPVVSATPAATGTANTASTSASTNGQAKAIVTRFEGANALIISAPLDVQRSLGEVIRQLDVRQQQVLVEAIIVEISDSVARELGVQFLIGGKDVPFAVTNFSNVSPNIIDVAGGLLADQFDRSTTTVNGTLTTTTTNSTVGDQLRTNAATSILGARGGFSGFATDLGSNAVLGAIINAVQSDTESNILSTPSLTANNNVKGHILFGQEIPVSTGEALSDNFDNRFRTIKRQNVGIELEVKPQINAGNEVRLELRQQVSSIAGPVSKDFSELIINKREISTTVTVGNGEIVALGGLLDDNERRTIQKIPLLGDIPLIGELFKSRAKSRVKTNLMVFIRPTILRNINDARRLTNQRYDYVRSRQKARNPDQEPSIDELVRDYMGTSIAAPDNEKSERIGPDGAKP